MNSAVPPSRRSRTRAPLRSVSRRRKQGQSATTRARTTCTRPAIEVMEGRCLLSNGLWVARLDGLPGDTPDEQIEAAESLLHNSQLTDDAVRVVDSTGVRGIFIIQTPPDANEYVVRGELQGLPGFRYVVDYTPDGSSSDYPSTPNEGEDEGLFDPPDLNPGLDPSQDPGGADLNVGLSGNEPALAVNPLNPSNVVIAQYNAGQQSMM